MVTLAYRRSMSSSERSSTHVASRRGAGSSSGRPEARSGAAGRRARGNVGRRTQTQVLKTTLNVRTTIAVYVGERRVGEGEREEINILKELEVLGKV